MRAKERLKLEEVLTIADPICIPSPDQRLNPRLHHIRKRSQERTTICQSNSSAHSPDSKIRSGARHTVTRRRKLVIRRIRTLLILGLRANRLHHGRILQIAHIRRRRIRIRARGADIIDVEVSGRGERSFDPAVTDIIRVHAGGVGTRDAAALFERGHAVGVVSIGVGCPLRRVDEGAVGVAEAVVDVGFVLEDRVEPAVVDAEGDERDLVPARRSRCDGCILGFEVGGEFGAVVAAVGFGEDAEVAVFVLRELGVEGLEERPDEGGGGDGRGGVVVAVGETEGYRVRAAL